MRGDHPGGPWELSRIIAYDETVLDHKWLDRWLNERLVGFSNRRQAIVLGWDPSQLWRVRRGKAALSLERYVHLLQLNGQRPGIWITGAVEAETAGDFGWEDRD